MRKITFVFILLFTVIPSLAHSDQPLNVIQRRVDQVINILEDHQYKEKEQKDLQREKIWEVILQIFDFWEMTKRTLARDWKNFTKQQRKEFSHLFSKLLGHTYLDKIQKGYQDEKVIYLAQEMISNSKALVKTKILRESIEIPVFYKMINRGENWKVYDVNIEGVSLVKNYRSQFSQILFKRSPAKLIDMLRKKMERQKSGRNRADRNLRLMEQRMVFAYLWQPLKGHYPRLKEQW